MKKIFTVCIIHQHPKILLGMKKRGFGAGRWNGFGGKIEEGETIEDALKREVLEESGLKIKDFEKVGIITFDFQNGHRTAEVHFFKTRDFEGDLIETEEMNPKWFHIDEIPYEEMWSDDIYWMHLLLEGKKFKGKFLMDRPSDEEYSAKILEKELIEVDII